VKFDMLWAEFLAFRRLFNHHGIEGKEEAQKLWNKRFPRLQWAACRVEGCNTLTVDNECCIRHVAISKSMATWQLLRGELFRLLRFRHLEGGCESGQEYRSYLLHVCIREHGSLAVGYEPYRIDGNPFNLHPDNVVQLSRALIVAVDAGVVSVADALEADSRISDIVARFGRRPQSVALVGHRHVARATGLSRSGVRSAIGRGRLDMDNPLSVLQFVASKRYENLEGTK